MSDRQNSLDNKAALNLSKLGGQIIVHAYECIL